MKGGTGTMKLVGYAEMKKRKGKILFTLEENPSQAVTGFSVEKYFIYGDLADSVTRSFIGHQVKVEFTQGFDGKAYPSSIIQLD